MLTLNNTFLRRKRYRIHLRLLQSSFTFLRPRPTRPRIPTSQVPTHAYRCPRPLVPVPLLYTAKTYRLSAMILHSQFNLALQFRRQGQFCCLRWRFSLSKCLNYTKECQGLACEYIRFSSLFPAARKAFVHYAFASLQKCSTLMLHFSH